MSWKKFKPEQISTLQVRRRGEQKTRAAQLVRPAEPGSGNPVRW
jgi:hypothetical protein